MLIDYTDRTETEIVKSFSAVVDCWPLTAEAPSL